MLEPAIGRLRFVIVYFVSLLAGSFGALLVEPNALEPGDGMLARPPFSALSLSRPVPCQPRRFQPVVGTAVAKTATK